MTALHVPGADNLLRGSLLHASENQALAHWLTHHPLGRQVASRFVAGESIEQALDAVAALARTGITATLDHLGETVRDAPQAEAATLAELDLLQRLAPLGPACNLSLKLTQLGLDISPSLAEQNLLRVLARAGEVDQFVRLDMEDSHHTAATLKIFQAAWAAGHRNCGIVLQAYLHRTQRDVDMALELGCRVRLCKGAYAEPASVAFANKTETDENYVALAWKLLARGYYPALATHDERIINRVKLWPIDPQQFEFQMLYGVRPELQRRLAQGGFRVRAYVPFGVDWYAYFMRRLAERPANLRFFLATLLKEPFG